MDIHGIDYLGIDRVLKRGSGEILYKEDNALLVKDNISGAYFLACLDVSTGLSVLDKHIGQDCNLLMVSDYNLGKIAVDKYGFAEKIECYQVAYYGEKPSTATELSIRTATIGDLPTLTKNYHMLSEEELEQIVLRKSILLGYYNDQLVGFIGEHLEGSMGLLYVFPEYRHRGFGAELQRHLMARTIDEGFIPFGQVEKDNLASLNLQKKLGMTVSDNQIVWMWK